MQRTTEEKLLAALSHAGFFFFHVILALVIYLLYKDKSEFVARHAKEALVVQLAFAATAIVGGLLCIVLIGFVILAVLGVAGVVYAICAIIAIIKAIGGEEFRYPLTSQFAQRL